MTEEKETEYESTKSHHEHCTKSLRLRDLSAQYIPTNGMDIGI